MSGQVWSRSGYVLLAAVGVVLAALGPARADGPLFDFENDAQGWQSQQAESTVGRTSEAANVKSGQGALEWTYNASLETAQIGVMSPSVPAGASTISFWAKCSSA